MRAITITAFVLCVALVFGMLGGLGWFGWVGVNPDPGIDGVGTDPDDGEVGGVVGEQAGNVSASGEGESNEGILGLVSSTLDVLNALRYLTTQTASALINLGVPAYIGWTVQGIVTFTVLIGFVQIVRGMRFR